MGIIPRVLHYLKSQQAVGIHVVPLWNCSHFWPLSHVMRMQLPSPLSVVSLYLFKVQRSGASSSSVILVHAALK